jgi:hypothetical protein
VRSDDIIRCMRPYCHNSTAAKTQAPVKIIQRNSGAASAVAAAVSRAGEKAMTLMRMFPLFRRPVGASSVGNRPIKPNSRAPSAASAADDKWDDLVSPRRRSRIRVGS